MRSGLAAILGVLLFALPASAEPIARTDGDDPDTMVEVTQLKRSGDVLMLRFTMVNNGSKPVTLSGIAFGDGTQGKDYGSVGGVHIIDPVNKKKHLVIRDSEGNCLCSRGLKSLASKGKINLWARFPAPPASVQKVTVVVPHFIPMDDVPISQ